MPFENFVESCNTSGESCNGVLPSVNLNETTTRLVNETVSKIPSMEEVKSSYNTLLEKLPEKYKKLLENFYKRNCDFCKKEITLGGY